MSNWVHVCANNYRQLINAMSYPGDKFSIELENVVNDFSETIDSHVLLMAKMLLDSEVTFSVVARQAEGIISCIKTMTSARVEKIEAADYIFLIDDSDGCENNGTMAEKVFAGVKKGDLIDPHCSGTILVFKKSSKVRQEYRFRGPGILGDKVIELSDIQEILKSRNNNMAEFPMGFDVFVFNNENSVLALPRTTIIEEVV